MPERLSGYDAAYLLRRLAEKGWIPGERAEDFILERQREKDLPLHVRMLAGLGALIASVCFIFFLETADVIDFSHKTEVMLWGLIFIGAAVGLHRIAGGGDTVKQSFLTQISFIAMVAGKILFVIAAGLLIDDDSGWGVTAALIIVTMVTYGIYRLSLDRFLSVLAILLSLWGNILDDPDIGGGRELWLHAFFLLQVIGAAVLCVHGKVTNDYMPLAYALIFSLCFYVLLLAAQAGFGDWRLSDFVYPIFINAVLGAGLIALFGWAAGDLRKLRREPLALACVGAVCLGLISAPGLLLAIGLMILGYAGYDRLLLILGACLIPVFLVLFYYNLDISLVEKSGALIGSGLVLLAGRFYMRQRGWDKA